MAFNFTENGILAYAIDKIRQQYDERIGPWNERDGSFYVGNPRICFLQVVERDCKIVYCTLDLSPRGATKLTLGVLGPYGKCTGPDTRIAPVDCYNLMEPGEDLYRAQLRLRKDGIISPF